MKKQEKGITLIALVITIIVLVILVGVSVSTVINTGLIVNSKNAVANYEIEEEKEEIELTILESAMNKEDEELNIVEILKNKYGEEKVEGSDDENSAILTMESENRYKVTKDGEVILLDETEEKVIISFLINDNEYFAEEGMTWAKWVESEYNNNDTKYDCTEDRVYSISMDVVKHKTVDSCNLGHEVGQVLPNEVLSCGCEYSCGVQGGMQLPDF